MSEENGNKTNHASKEETTAKYKALIAAWKDATSVGEVATKTGLSVVQVNAMASAIRKNKGQEFLKKMPRKNTRVDWDSLQTA